MRYISIDIETTGLDPETCQVIEFGAVIDDTTKPFDCANVPIFHRYVSYPMYTGEPYALSMHGQLFKKLAAAKGEAEITAPDWLFGYFSNWLQENWASSENPTIAGKNFAMFDLAFLRKLQGFCDWKIKHRVLDPGSMFLRADDVNIPDTKTCIDRAGLDCPVSHNAVEDAIIVCKLIRAGLR